MSTSPAPEARIEAQLAASPAAREARDALAAVADAWIVGGSVRDALLGRAVEEVDIVVPDGEERAARTLAGEAGADVFVLSESYAAWRVLGPGGEWQVDVARMRGHGIGEDLEARDFTINAMAIPLVGGDLLDPFDGLRDLDESRVRAVRRDSFDADPLRVLRAARLGAQLGFRIGDGTVALARQCARRIADIAAERAFAELRLLVTGPDPLRGFELLDLLGATRFALPEFEGRERPLAVLQRVAELERDPGTLFAELDPALAEFLAEPLADWLSRGGALRFGALFHTLDRADIRSLARRLHFSRKLTRHLELLAHHHARLGSLAGQAPLDRRAIFEYLTATRPAALDVTLLATAADPSLSSLARELAAEALAWRRDGPPVAPIRGDELAKELGIEEGPELGRLLHELAAASYAGEIATPADAIALARRLHTK